MKMHSKKPAGSKEKKSRVDPDLETGDTLNTKTASAATDPATAPLIPPDFLNAIRMSLQDDLLQICQQACQQALDNRDTRSSSSSIPASPNLTQAPDKRRAHTKKHSHPPNKEDVEDVALEEDDDEAEEDADDGDSEPFSRTEDADPEAEPEDNIVRFLIQKITSTFSPNASQP